MHNFKKVLKTFLVLVVCVALLAALDLALYPCTFMRNDVHAVVTQQFDDIIVGTSHGKMDIDPEVMQRRAEVLMTEQLSIAEEINKTFVGKTFTVMVEDMDEESGLYYGRSYMDAPDIDTKVYFSSEEDLCPGDFVEVVIENFVEYDLVGHIKE